MSVPSTVDTFCELGGISLSLTSPPLTFQATTKCLLLLSPPSPSADVAATTKSLPNNGLILSQSPPALDAIWFLIVDFTWPPNGNLPTSSSNCLYWSPSTSVSIATTNGAFFGTKSSDSPSPPEEEDLLPQPAAVTRSASAVSA